MILHQVNGHGHGYGNGDGYGFGHGHGYGDGNGDLVAPCVSQMYLLVQVLEDP